jgi:hypothetical protein
MVAHHHARPAGRLSCPLPRQTHSKASERCPFDPLHRSQSDQVSLAMSLPQSCTSLT